MKAFIKGLYEICQRVGCSEGPVRWRPEREDDILPLYVPAGFYKCCELCSLHPSSLDSLSILKTFPSEFWMSLGPSAPERRRICTRSKQLDRCLGTGDNKLYASNV